MPTASQLLQSVIDEFRPLLLNMEASEAAQRPAPDKWSPKEIIGHLVDSASNNHQRFVRAQFKNELIFEGYTQDGWVDFQDYQNADWENLVQLWYYFNWQIARIMALTPESQRTAPRTEHNLDKIVMRTVPADEPASLGYFMDDYVFHLEHHIRQIFPDYEIRSTN